MSARMLLSVACIAGIGFTLATTAPLASPDYVAAPASLWEAPHGGHERDLFNGPWGAGLAPDPHDTYTLVGRKQKGVNPGIIVTDSRGHTWHVKQAPESSRGAEGPVEVAISRVLSAVGYHQPPVYYLPSFTLKNGSHTHVEPGGRFRRSDPALKSIGPWAWKDNPFVGTQPFDGLLVILRVFNSWDLKDNNNRIYESRREGRVEHWYVVRDLGGALGEDDGISPKRNNLELYERSRYIKGVDKGYEGFVKFSYRGKRQELLDRRITLEDVRWASSLLAGLDDRQWRDAFRAGGYGDVVSDRFIRKIHDNINQGLHLTNPTWRSADDGR